MLATTNGLLDILCWSVILPALTYNALILSATKNMQTQEL